MFYFADREKEREWVHFRYVQILSIHLSIDQSMSIRKLRLGGKQSKWTEDNNVQHSHRVKNSVYSQHLKWKTPRLKGQCVDYTGFLLQWWGISSCKLITASCLP